MFLGVDDRLLQGEVDAVNIVFGIAGRGHGGGDGPDHAGDVLDGTDGFPAPGSGACVLADDFVSAGLNALAGVSGHGE